MKNLYEKEVQHFQLEPKINICDIGTNSPGLPADIKFPSGSVNHYLFGADADLSTSVGGDLLPDLDPTKSEESFTFLGRSKGSGTLYVTAQELASSLFNPKLPPPI